VLRRLRGLRGGAVERRFGPARRALAVTASACEREPGEHLVDGEGAPPHRDPVARDELAAASRVDLPVDLYPSPLDECLGLAAAVDHPRQLEKVVETEDGGVSRGGHGPLHLARSPPAEHENRVRSCGRVAELALV
jgi:hypothetical protein